MNATVYADGFIVAGDAVWKASIGRGGIAIKGGEGDGISPEGTWPLRKVFYRADRLPVPETGLPVRAIEPDDAWCDVAGDPFYNRLVKLPYPVADEYLWRQDSLYDLIVVVGYNDMPVIDGKGSAIFLHVARPDGKATAGCAALNIEDLTELVRVLTPDSTVTFTRQPWPGALRK